MPGIAQRPACRFQRPTRDNHRDANPGAKGDHQHPPFATFRVMPGLGHRRSVGIVQYGGQARNPRQGCCQWVAIQCRNVRVQA